MSRSVAAVLFGHVTEGVIRITRSDPLLRSIHKSTADGIQDAYGACRLTRPPDTRGQLGKRKMVILFVFWLGAADLQTRDVSCKRCDNDHRLIDAVWLTGWPGLLICLIYLVVG